jgi:hypothetical protein
MCSLTKYLFVILSVDLYNRSIYQPSPWCIRHISMGLIMREFVYFSSRY